MSVTWIRTDFNFGLPHKTLTLNMESELAIKFFGFMRDSESQDPEKIAFLAAQTVIEARPQLAAGLILLSINADPWKRVWEFTVAHPSFPRVNAGECAPKERLETCAVCRGPLPGRLAWSRIEKHTQKHEWCCSQECAEVGQNRITPKVKDADGFHVMTDRYGNADKTA